MIDAKYVDMKKINVGVRDDEKFIDLSEIDIGFSMAEFQKILDERKRTLRALWLARAKLAREFGTKDSYDRYVIQHPKTHLNDTLHGYLIWSWDFVCAEQKCLKKAEEYKNGYNG